MQLMVIDVREEKQADNTPFTLQAYLIGTVNTIQSIQCSKTQACGLPNGTQTKKCKNTPSGRPYKGKEVLLCKADKVMVRLSIVKIDVFLFKLYLYTHIYFL